MHTAHYLDHIKIPTLDITMDGLEEFLKPQNQLEDTILPLLSKEINYVKIISEWTQNGHNSTTDIIYQT